MLICWIVLYSTDSAIQRLNNGGLQKIILVHLLSQRNNYSNHPNLAHEHGIPTA